MAALVTWWSGPPNALYADAFHANEFDMQGIVPVAYAVFGVALGIAAGALLRRRTLPAIAVTLAGFIGVRVLVAQVFRAHYLTAVTTYYSLTSNWQPTSGSWILGERPRQQGRARHRDEPQRKGGRGRSRERALGRPARS